jgi:hypothetical protein
MAKARIDSLMKEALEVASDRWARSGVDKSKQIVTITNHNLKEAFKEAFSKSHQKEFPGMHVPFENPEDVYKKAAGAARTALLTHLENARSKSNLHHKDGNKVVFTSDRTFRTPFTKMKQAGIKYINKELKAHGRPEMSEGQKQTVNMGMQRLHQNVTVGLARLTKVLDVLEGDDLIGSKFKESNLMNTIQDKFGDVLADFELVQDSKGKETIRYTGQVAVLVQRKGKNFPGSEHGDWAKVSKFLEKELTKWLNSKEIAKIPGSKSIEEEALEKATSVAMKNLTKAAAVKALTGIPKAKSTPKKGDSKRKGKKPASARRARAAVSGVARVKKSEVSSILRSIAIINKELPDTVRKNMQSPQLVNRTGRFAESVRITDVVQTPKGYPSIGYTYQRNPYGVFEDGGGSAPWANGERDPRELIDKSIREIAANMAIGRFYTRRQ